MPLEGAATLQLGSNGHSEILSKISTDDIDFQPQLPDLSVCDDFDQRLSSLRIPRYITGSY